MKIIDHTSVKTIELHFPKELLENIATQEAIDVENLSPIGIRRLFRRLIHDWFNGTVVTEELSSLASFLLNKLEDQDTELAARLVDATELSYYVRHPNKDNGEPLYGFVTRLREYSKI